MPAASFAVLIIPTHVRATGRKPKAVTGGYQSSVILLFAGSAVVATKVTLFTKPLVLIGLPRISQARNTTGTPEVRKNTLEPSLANGASAVRSSAPAQLAGITT